MKQENVHTKNTRSNSTSTLDNETRGEEAAVPRQGLTCLQFFLIFLIFSFFFFFGVDSSKTRRATRVFST